MKFSKYISKAVTPVMALFQKQHSCLSNKATTICGYSVCSLRQVPVRHNRGGKSTENKVRLAPPTMCRLTSKHLNYPFLWQALPMSSDKSAPVFPVAPAPLLFPPSAGSESEISVLPSARSREFSFCQLCLTARCPPNPGIHPRQNSMHRLFFYTSHIFCCK